MKREAHLQVDKFIWNIEYNDVHAWIDSTFAQHAGKNPYKHWLDTHHQQAIREKYGDFTPEFNAAYVHILMDFLSHCQVAFVPVDRKECEEMLKALQLL